MLVVVFQVWKQETRLLLPRIHRVPDRGDIEPQCRECDPHISGSAFSVWRVMASRCSRKELRAARESISVRMSGYFLQKQPITNFHLEPKLPPAKILRRSRNNYISDKWDAFSLLFDRNGSWASTYLTWNFLSRDHISIYSFTKQNRWREKR